jgi:hypothetical protein
MLDSPSKSGNRDPVALDIPSYAALLDRKMIIPSASQPYLAVDQHFFFDHFAQILRRISFDETWYLTKYRDIRDAIEKGSVVDARQHYVRFGYYEHRLPYKIDVDAVWYLETYPDVKVAVERRHYTSGQAHFETAGFREGRLPYPNFALRLVD